MFIFNLNKNMEEKMQLKNIVLEAIGKILKGKGMENIQIEIERPKNSKFGDYSTNIAMKSAKILKKAPFKIAEEFKIELEKEECFKKVEIASPGFINFYFTDEIFEEILKEILNKKEDFGKINIGNQEKVMVEYVSANPTGHLHVGHGRGAVVGDVLSKVLSYVGYDVLKEYYLNDAGSQIDKLSKSVYLRYKELLGEKIEFISDGYKGEYIYEIAEGIKEKYNEEKNKKFLEVEEFFKEYSLNWCIDAIKSDLKKFGIEFDNWFSEKSLYSEKLVEKTVKELEEKKFIYTKDGAKWFETTKFGDDKDRVVIRANQSPTYYASDIAYHENKLMRGYKKLINVWGADHHGYVKRVESAIEALGYGKDTLDVILVQIVNLFKDGQPFVMSKRTGNFITMEDLISEIGRDASRIFFIMRSSDSQFDFDLDVAKKESSDNPAYYIQYAYARSSSILRKSKINLDKLEDYKLNLLIEPEEIGLIKKMDEFKEVLETISQNYEVHRLINYATELAALLHSYYNKHKVLIDNNEELMIARLSLIESIRIVLRNILNIVGVNVLEKM